MHVDVFILALSISKKAFDTISPNKIWERLQNLGVPPHLQYVVKVMYTTIYAKVWINGDTCGEVMSDVGVKQGWSPLPHTLRLVHWCNWNIFGRDQWGFPLLIWHSVLPFFVMLTIFVLLSRLNAGLQRHLNMLYEFFASSSLEVNLAKIKIMLFGRNKRKLHQEAFYIDNDQIEITHENTLGLIFIHWLLWAI